MMPIRMIAACLLVAATAFAVRPYPPNLATDTMAGPEEDSANKDMLAIKPQTSPDAVKQQVSEFLNKYPGSKRRRDVRARLMQAYVLGGKSDEAVEECLYQTIDMPGSYLGDLTLRDSWAELASLLARDGRLADSARVRTRTFARFPYQLENRRQIALAVAELAKAQRHDDVLATAKLALMILPDAESAGTLEILRQSLTARYGQDAVFQFDAFWQYGAAGPDGQLGTRDDCINPLRDVALPELESMQKTAISDLANRAILLESPETGSLQMGVLHLLAGDYDRAAAELQNAVAGSAPDKKDSAADLAGIYFRWIDGSAARARQYRAFVRFRSAGPDGLSGTADDLVNPFPQVSSAAPARQ